MKSKLFTLAIISTLVAGTTALTGTCEPAMAQGARFQFTPNVWRKAEPRHPKRHMGPQQHRVTHGAVPRGGSSFLGVDPSFIKKPVVAAKPRPVAVPVVTPKISVPRINGTYKKNFGKPSPLTAKKPQSLSVPQQRAAAPVQARKSTAAKLAPKKRRAIRKKSGRRASRSLKGRMVPPRKPKAQLAKGYGGKFFQQGTYIPTKRKYGSGSSSTVKGKLLRYK